MLFNKKITKDIHIIDPIEFCTSKEEYTKRQLINKYVGKCFDGVYIVNINKILNISDCYINRTDINASATITVEFIVDCQQFSYGDILFGIKITKDDGLQSGYISNPTFSAKVSLQNDIPIRKDQLIPIKINTINYPYLQYNTHILGSFKGCKKDIIIYQLGGKITKEIVGELNPYIENVINEYSIYSNIVNSIIKNDDNIYEKLFTTNKKLKSRDIIINNNIKFNCMAEPRSKKSNNIDNCLSIFDIINENTILDGEYSFVEDDSIISPMITKVSYDIFNKKIPLVSLDVKIWLAKVLRTIYLNVRFLEDFITTYPNLNDESISNIIMLINKN